MRCEIEGKSTGVGAFADGFIIGHQPDRTESSHTGNHWMHIYKDVSEDAIVIEFGHSRGGKPWRNAKLVNGQPVPAEKMRLVEQIPEWQEYEP